MGEDAKEGVALLQTAVDRFARRPGYMAHLLAALLGGDVAARRIAAEFDCSPETAVKLALMRVPREDKALLLEDVARIADATSIDRLKLLSAVKQARALAVFGETKDVMLMAARDVYSKREDDDR